MNSSNFRFVLDLHSTQSQVSIPVTLGDTARVWYISLSDGGLPYIIEDGCLAKIEIKRPTGTFLAAFCPIEKNTTVKYDFSQDEITVNTAAVEGVHDCSVTIYDAEGNKIGSPRFSMVVSERVINSDDINLTDDDKSAIEAMIAAEASRQAAETGRVNAEASRQEAELGRQETLRQFNEALTNGSLVPLYSSVQLNASAWVGTDAPYSQVVTVEGVTSKSKVDLLPSVEQLTVFHDKDIAFVTENEDGIVTVYCIGDKPTQDYTMEVCITEVVI